ncbi:MAG: tRNA preQ1(34) S-adenosylmethionine ribosyltransferase-isomerase QueA [Terrimicrobiaceae bacterium]
MSDYVSDYDFELPGELIAGRPPARRDEARMLVLERDSGQVSHAGIGDLPDFLEAGDLAVMNDTRVIRARLLSEDGKTEVFLAERLEPRVWKCLVRPGKKFRQGSTLAIASTKLTVRDVAEDGTRVVEFEQEPDLEREGRVPIPPYFGREADDQDAERYQTVYAREAGSVAAPTAGLHFTPELLEKVPHVFVTLHVGLGTFQSVKCEALADHKMHDERYRISSESAASINAARRILAVGTTVTRVLESQPDGPLCEGSGSTDIFIRPPHDFRRVGALLTNFHLPKSTLLMLVSAFAGREAVLAAYEEAVAERYRFYSYGDCMLIR